MNFVNAGLVGAPGQWRPDMERQLQSAAPESKTLQRCINDLVSLLALPAMWSRSEPSQIVQSLLDALLRMLSLDFAYARLKDPVSTELIEILRLDVSRTLYMSQQDMAGMLNEWFGGDGQKSFQPLRTRLGDRYISISQWY